MNSRIGRVNLQLLMLCGYPGSGKTDLCAHIQRICPEIFRVSQDELGDRKSCENAILIRIAQLLDTAEANDTTESLTVLVDRCNFNRQQRQTWITLARAFKGSAKAIHLDVPLYICAQRIRKRTDHPKGVHGDFGTRCLKYFVRDWESPQAEQEGIDSVLYLKNPSTDVLESEQFSNQIHSLLENDADSKQVSEDTQESEQWRARLEVAIIIHRKRTGREQLQTPEEEQ